MMKKTILFILVMTCLNVIKLKSQGYDSSDMYTLDYIQSRLSTLNPSRITTGILHDRVIPFGSIRDLKWATDTPELVGDWDQNYLELYNSALNKTGWIPIDSIKKWRKYYLDMGINPILISAYNYNLIKDSAIVDSLIDTTGGYVYDNMKTISPYFEYQYISVSGSSRCMGDSTAKFTFKPEFFFSNFGSLPTSIEADFGDGFGFVPISWNVIYLINYTTFDERYIKVRLGFSTPFPVIYERVMPYQKYNSKRSSTLFTDVTVNIENFVALIPYEGQVNRANINILLGKSGGLVRPCIEKPLIIIEGIDFGYDDLPTGCRLGKCGNVGFIDFKTGKDNNTQNGSAEPSQEFEKAPEMLKQLQDLGYDVIFVDFHDGADYIERNAMVVVELIQRLNGNSLTGVSRCGNEEIVVLGASMGGLVARYALSYMEANNLDHCTRLMATFDSPHKGANITLGLQSFLHYLAKNGKADGKDKVDRMLNRPATKQLLMESYNASNNNFGMDALRASFISNLNAVGNYPVRLRKIAISNGSSTMQNQGYSAGTKLVECNWHWVVANVDIDIWAMKGATYKGKNNLIMHADIPKAKRGFTSVNSGSPEYDHAPGGNRKDLKSLDGKIIQGKGYRVYSKALQNFACFIPTISALDINTTDFFYNVNTNIAPMSSPNSNHPFESVYYQGSNELHVQITLNGLNGSGTGNADYFIREILANEYEAPATLSTNYNLGKEMRKSLRSMTIQSGGNLKINSYEKIKYGGGSDPMTDPGSSYVVKTTDCSPYVTVQGNGTMTLGSVAATTNVGVVYFRKGSTLELKANSTLRICNGSSLIIEKGAKLIYNSGASIILEGSDAILEIKGKVILKNGSTFSFTKGGASQGGHIRIQAQPWNDGDGKFELDNSAVAAISLTGDNYNDLVLEIDGSLTMPGSITSPTKYLSSVSISNGRVAYGSYSSLNVESPLIISGSKFEAQSWSIRGNNTGLTTLGQTGVTISNSTFKNLNYGISITNNLSNGNRMILSGVTFTTCNTGAKSTNVGVSIDNCKFSSNVSVGLQVLNASNDSRIINNTEFNSNSTGLWIYSASNQVKNIYIANSKFYNNVTATESVYGDLTINCTIFGTNDIGVLINDAELNLSSTRSVSNTAVGVNVNGNNTTFVNNNFGIVLSNAKPYLSAGNINFMDISAPYNFITGTVPYNTGYVGSSPYSLIAGGNYWEPVPASLATAGSNYSSVTTVISGTLVTLPLSGSMNPSVNTTCYNIGGGCNPCEVVVKEKDKSEFADPEFNAKVSPNPVSVESEFVLTLESSDQSKEIKASEVRVVNVEGKVMYQSLSEASLYIVNTNKWASGFYFVEIRTENSVKILRVFVK